MDVVLITARGTAATPHWSRRVADQVVAQLQRDGARVRWLCALGADETEPAPAEGIEVTPVRGAAVPFRKVLARVEDTALDVALARLLRPLARPVVAHLGFGAPGSVTTLWIAERMGARALAAVCVPEVLCHRGTLVDAGGAPCANALDPARCAECASAAWQNGLSPRQARVARWLRPLGAWSPFPNENGFASRADLVLASLQLATVLVRDAAEGEALRAAGLPPRNLRVVDTGAAADAPFPVATLVAEIAGAASAAATAQ